MNLTTRLNHIEDRIPPPAPSPAQSALSAAIDEKQTRLTVMLMNLFDYQVPDAETLMTAAWESAPALLLSLAIVHRLHNDAGDMAIAERIEERAKVLAGELGEWLDASTVNLPGDCRGDWRDRWQWAKDHYQPPGDDFEKLRCVIPWKR